MTATVHAVPAQTDHQPSPARPSARQEHVLRETVSPHGRRTVRLIQALNGYEGAQPYFTVQYMRANGLKAQCERYTPSADRAERLFELFSQDITEPAQLR
jgi:hypothetical protein